MFLSTKCAIGLVKRQSLSHLTLVAIMNSYCVVITLLLVHISRYTDCLYCFHCQDITTEQDCNIVTKCQADSGCYIERDEQGNSTLFSMGCTTKQNCPDDRQFTIIGRSVNSNCKKCCFKDGCNKELCEVDSQEVRQLTNGNCTDDPSQNCSGLSNVLNICSDPHRAKDICRKYCGLCDMVDGGWSRWTKWLACSTTCGLGVTSRSRQCTNPAPRHGGYNCSGNSTQYRSCFPRACPVHGQWNTWGSWEDCSVPCGNGLKKRHRTCTDPPPSMFGHFCLGDPVEYSLCKGTVCGNQTTQAVSVPTVSHCFDILDECGLANKTFGLCKLNQEAARKSCPQFCGLCGIIDGAWAAWTDWTSCSTSCGKGSVTRSRSCSNPSAMNGGKNCSGNATEVKDCILRDCPVHGGWNTWTRWSSCTSTCGEGLTHRTRACDNPRPSLVGNYCFGEPSEYAMCRIRSCPDNVNNTKASYAFYAFSPSTLHPSSTIVFTKTIDNEQNVYNTRNGNFTAPVGGIYTFESTLCTDQGKAIWVIFNATGRGNVGEFTAGASSHKACASGSTTLRLQAGSTVFLQVTQITAGATLQNTPYTSSFSVSVQPSYAFFAYNPSTMRPTTGSIIRFRNTLINEQNVYNTGNGHFNAPIGGVYIFHSTICTEQLSSVSVEIYMDGQGTAGKFAAGDGWNNCVSGSTTARLQTGSQVYMRVTGTTFTSSLKNRPFMNTFSGYILSM